MKLTFKQFLINEAPIPGNWSPTIFTDETSFKSQLKYASERAKRIGAGSSRVAFIIKYKGRDTVLKIAKNKKGLVQNETEVNILTDGMSHYYSDITIPLIDYDKKSELPRWVHTRLARKATESDFIQKIHGTLFDLLDTVLLTQGEPMLYNKTPPKLNTRTALVTKFPGFIIDFDFNPVEFRVLSNWGVYKNRLVILDAGANNDVLTTLYDWHR